MNPRSKYAAVRTCKMHPVKRREKSSGEVPMPQLYRDIEAGYRYFLARRTQAMALGLKLTDLKK